MKLFRGLAQRLWLLSHCRWDWYLHESLPTAHSGIAHNFYIFYTNSNILTIFGIKYLFRAKTIVHSSRWAVSFADFSSLLYHKIARKWGLKWITYHTGKCQNLFWRLPFYLYPEVCRMPIHTSSAAKFCQCTDRQHCTFKCLCCWQKLVSGGTLSDSAALFRTGNCRRRMGTAEISADWAPTLAPACCFIRNYSAFCGRIFPGTAESVCQCLSILFMRHAGSDIPQGQRICLCQHHVYRQSPKLYGISVRLCQNAR